ncbi:hypothetical protein, partial [Dickeya dianthicola]|uniref:hypothetical protein n=1 Tax=Dickeya dianthicola TaxID=204039 RepID=UPI001EE77E8D
MDYRSWCIPVCCPIKSLLIQEAFFVRLRILTHTTNRPPPHRGSKKRKYEEEQLWRHVTKSLLGMPVKVTVAFSFCQYKSPGR